MYKYKPFRRLIKIRETIVEKAAPFMLYSGIKKELSIIFIKPPANVKYITIFVFPILVIVVPFGPKRRCVKYAIVSNLNANDADKYLLPNIIKITFSGTNKRIVIIGNDIKHNHLVKIW